MVFFKSCRKCGGDLMAGSDSIERYLECIQCGLVVHGPTRRFRYEQPPNAKYQERTRYRGNAA